MSSESAKAEKKKTGFQNRLAAMVALWALGEHDILKEHVRRLCSFWALQEQLQAIQSLYTIMGINAFYVLG